MAEWVVFESRAPAVDVGARAEAMRALGYQEHHVDDGTAAKATWAARALGAFVGVLSDERSETAIRDVEVRDVDVTVTKRACSGVVAVVAMYAVGSGSVEVRFSPLHGAVRADPDALLAQVVLTFEVVAKGDQSPQGRQGLSDSGDDDTAESIRLTRFVVGGKDGA